MSKNLDQRIKDAIATLVHEDDALWLPDGRPKAEAVQVALADPSVEVSQADVMRIAPKYRRAGPEELAAHAASGASADELEDSRPEPVDPRLKDASDDPAQRPLASVKAITVQEARAKLAVLDSEYLVVEQALIKATADKTRINKERDKLYPILAPQTGNELAHTIQEYQKRSHAEQTRRVSGLQDLSKVLSQMPGLPQPSASPLDASRGVRRGHGEGLKPQPQVRPSTPADVGKSAA